jgi:hypothetical protein
MHSPALIRALIVLCAGAWSGCAAAPGNRADGSSSVGNAGRTGSDPQGVGGTSDNAGGAGATPTSYGGMGGTGVAIGSAGAGGAAGAEAGTGGAPVTGRGGTGVGGRTGDAGAGAGSVGGLAGTGGVGGLAGTGGVGGLAGTGGTSGPAGASGKGGAGGAINCNLPATVSFQKDVQPFLSATCGGGNGCHVIDSASTVANGGYDHAYDWITAGAHPSSCPSTPTPKRFQVVIAVIEAADPASCSRARIMPPQDETGANLRKPLTSCQVATLQAWLDEPLVTQAHRVDDTDPAGTPPFPMPPFN